jgi:hypothetical protein
LKLWIECTLSDSEDGLARRMALWLICFVDGINGVIARPFVWEDCVKEAPAIQ